MKATFTIPATGGGIETIAPPTSVCVPLTCQQTVVQPGETVARGQRIATTCVPGAPDVHAPLAGTITEVHPGGLYIRLEAKGHDQAEPVSVADADDAMECLRSLGVDMRGIGQAETLVINALPPDAGVTVFERIVAERTDTVARGAALLKRACGAARVVLLLPEDAQAGDVDGCETRRLPAAYPDTLHVPALAALSGSETAHGFAAVTAAQAHAAGVASQGMAVTTTFLSIGSRNFEACIGHRLDELIDDQMADKDLRPRDRVILGGPMRGEAARGLDQGLDRDTHGLFVVPHGAYPPVADAPCTNCGECVLVCPARLQPNLITRAAEFKLYARAEAYHVDTCFECGLCGWVCQARRPMMQYLRLAKRELELLREAEAALAAERDRIGREPATEEEA